MQSLSGTGLDGPLVIGYVGGGSHGWATTLMNDLAQSPLDATVRLYDLEYDAAAENAAFGNWVQDHDAARGRVEYVAERSLADALAGADVVVCSTADPPAETYAHDLELPREYGLQQTVGDTVGPGGTLRAMRAVPQYRDIAAAVREHCPSAWVINYTNPMSVCTRTLYAEYPDVRAVGLCHGVFAAQELLADLAAKYWDVEAEWQDVLVDVTGINHCTWLRAASWRGRDLLPLLDRELAEEGLEWGADAGDAIVDENRIAFDVYRRFGAFPAISGRHLAEFLPWYLNVDGPEAVRRWGAECNRIDDWLDDWEDRVEEHRALLERDGAFEFYDSGEAAVDIVEALAGGDAVRTNVNLPNAGQAPDLPDGAVVETNALVATDGVTPLTAGTLPREVCTLVERHVANQETLVAAGMDGDLDRAYRAFLADPLVSTLDPEAARALFRDLVAAQREYLGDWDLDGAQVLGGAP
jgi:alpha-galactosidase/6-phospho-beta-glucosidase family protein